MVYDNRKKLLAASGMMGTSEPAYPPGVLDYTAQKGEDRVTWQPQSGLRYATVALKTNSGYVVTGRSLLETEKLINKISGMVLLAWFVCLVCSILASAIKFHARKPRKIHDRVTPSSADESVGA